MFSPISVSLSVRLCTGYLKRLWTDPDEILWTGWVCDNDKLIRFWRPHGRRGKCDLGLTHRNSQLSSEKQNLQILEN